MLSIEREQQPAILLVNDNFNTLTALESALSDDAFCVVTASSGEQALRKLLDRDFACIILDVQMPGFDGFQTAEAIRDRRRTATTPIIFVTAAMVDSQSQFIGYERGAVDYLLTPIVPRVLKAKAAVFVELFKQKEQLERMTRELAAVNRELQTQQLAELARINSELSEEVAERRRAQERADFLASHDPLTGLLNRRALGDRVKHAVQTARRSQQSLALLFLDLDRFKTINDTLGHDVGDALLKQVAERLRGAVRESDTVARLGGDEFVVLLERLATPQNAADVAEKIVAALNEPFCVGFHTLNTSASIGISLFPGDAPSAEELLKHADIAMYHAKSRDRGDYQFFSDDLNAQMVARHELERELHQALKRGELALHYQPKVELASGSITGAEALLRWRHPERGLIASSQFIPVAEESRLIIPIGEWVLKEACSQVKQWERAGALPVEFGVAVNVSVAQVHPNLVKNVVDTLAAYEIPPRRLQLEITETLLSRNPAEASSLMQEISALGITIAIDDFGTGYSSLAALKNLPIETLKIDQSFVLDLTTDLNDAAIVAAIISMARSLGLKVVAEGVETEDQLSALKALGCDQYQGYLFSRPVPPDELARMLAAA